MNLQNIWPEWTVDRKIGQGSYGTVYKITKHDPGNEFLATSSALKVIQIPNSPEQIQGLYNQGLDKRSVYNVLKGDVEAIKNEIQVMFSLSSAQSVVKIEDYYIEEVPEQFRWMIYIRMELLESVPDYANRIGGLSKDDVVRMGCDICDALQACESRNIIHRDIKPANIFRSEFGQFKLGDFGVAKHIEDTTSAVTKVGTPSYEAPEVFRGLKYDHRVDTYGLGMVLYTYLNHGRKPFYPPYPRSISRDDMQTALDRRLSGEAVPRISGLDLELFDIVQRACAYHPDDRFQTAGEMKDALDRYRYRKTGAISTGGGLLTGGYENTGSGNRTGRYENTGGGTRTGGYNSTGGGMSGGGYNSTGGGMSGGGYNATGGGMSGGGYNSTGGGMSGGGYNSTGGRAVTGGHYTGNGTQKEAPPVPPRPEPRYEPPRKSSKHTKRIVLILGCLIAAFLITGLIMWLANRFAKPSDTEDPVQVSSAPKEAADSPDSNPKDLDLTPTEGPAPTVYAELGDGKSVHAELLELVGSSVNPEAKEFDWTIKSIQWASGAPVSNSSAVVISQNDSPEISAWFDADSGTVYLYSKEDTVKLGPDSSGLFEGFGALEQVDLSRFDTSQVKNMGRMFACCFNLTKLDLSGFDTSEVTDFHGMFDHCERLETLDLNAFSTEKAEDLSGMFDSCSVLKTLDASGFHTSNVTKMSGMFKNCRRLEELSVDFDTEQVTDMNTMFYHCDSLKKLDLSSFDTSHVTNMNFMFYYCMSLEELNLSSFNTAANPSVVQIFEGCSLLKEIKTNDNRLQEKFIETEIS